MLVFFLVMWIGGKLPRSPVARSVGRGVVGIALFLPWLLFVYPLAWLLGLVSGLSLNDRNGEG